MGIRRKFLDWKRPALWSAADMLLEQYHDRGVADLSHVVVVIPSRRAGRRFREILWEQANEAGWGLFPPSIVTVGGLPELLYVAKRPFASNWVQQFAWGWALQKAPRSTIQKIWPDVPPVSDDPIWIELGSLLNRQHQELAGHRLDFASVAKLGERIPDFPDVARWQALAKVQRAYLEHLDELGLWDRPTARKVAIEQHECQLQQELVLLGTVDLTRTTREMIAQVARTRLVRALVHAPEGLGHRFDQWGCVDAESWQSVRLPIEHRHLWTADGPANQADAVIHILDSLGGKYRADQITIGIPDPSLVAHVEHRCQQFDLPIRWGGGTSLNASRPVIWLRIFADYLQSFAYRHFAEWVRHPDTLRYLRRTGVTGDVVRELDTFFEKHLPLTINLDDRELLVKREDSEKSFSWIEPLQKLVQRVRPIENGETKGNARVWHKRPPGEWALPLEQLLWDVFAIPEFHSVSLSDRITWESCEQVLAALEPLRSIPEDAAPPVSLVNAILMLLSSLDQGEIATAAKPDAMEMIGWLDLPLDDAPVAIVTSLNEGIVPQTVNSDVFLPNRIRQELGLDDNAQRYARDAYAVQTLLESRQIARFIVGRRSADGDPLRPSRLVLAVDPDELPRQCLRLFHESPSTQEIHFAADRDDTAFDLPMPQPLAEPVMSLSVSDFGAYLECPYRFYLRRILRLDERPEETPEMNAAQFGELTHAVLEEFGRGPLRESSDEDEIRRYLRQRLEIQIRRQFGRHPSPAVQIQSAQLAIRFDAFAEQQAAWRREGWEITEHIEADPPGGSVPLEVDGRVIEIRGRIDRIDYHPTTNTYAVLDYKTGDKGEAPEDKHRKKRKVEGTQWVNLQLPLYRHLFRAFQRGHFVGPGSVRLGYVLLPSDPARTRFSLADWSDAELDSADEAARDVVRSIWREEFWPPAEGGRFDNDKYAVICQSRIFGRAPFRPLDVEKWDEISDDDATMVRDGFGEGAE